MFPMTRALAISHSFEQFNRLEKVSALHQSRAFCFIAFWSSLMLENAFRFQSASKCNANAFRGKLRLEPRLWLGKP